MKDTNERWILEDDDAFTDALLNEASEWLAYAQGTASLLAEWMRDDEGEGDRRELSLALGGVAAMMAVGRICVQRAHTQVLFDSPRHGDASHEG
ncbi:MAG: hypothetical protein GAK28_02566 [Luteibacter sp.]|uniref:hypothetical protein n=1 Tax=Luteibacter sp. TaxID=1886636 RepID=UPI001383A6B1|nr:hypothetical protein [Luteibacter sp.]KAF1006255.1 MAG: hypothetical protein GAK28_02566 [Luteibacter sp.]